MKKQTELDWAAIRVKAASVPDEAYKFIRDGLTHTVKTVHGRTPEPSPDPTDESRHISGQQLCQGLRDLAVLRYGLLARTVLAHWGINSTQDLGTLVYALIDRGELRSSSRDSLEDFKDVFDFEEGFTGAVLN